MLKSIRQQKFRRPVRSNNIDLQLLIKFAWLWRINLTRIFLSGARVTPGTVGMIILWIPLKIILCVWRKINLKIILLTECLIKQVCRILVIKTANIITMHSTSLGMIITTQNLKASIKLIKISLIHLR